jgi:hypothetical protein
LHTSLAAHAEAQHTPSMQVLAPVEEGHWVPASQGVPGGLGVQTPAAPARLHDSPWAHTEPQHTPSAQVPLAHSPSEAQWTPGG